jgi:hypothetical protein
MTDPEKPQNLALLSIKLHITATRTVESFQSIAYELV